MSTFLNLPAYVAEKKIDTDALDNIDTYARLSDIDTASITNFDRIYYIREEDTYYRFSEDTESFSKIFDLSAINSSLNSLFHLCDTKHNIADFQTEKDALNAAITEVDSRVTFLATIELAKLWAMKHDKIDINGNLAVKTLGTNDFRIVDFTSFDLSNSIRILPNGISFNDSEDIVLDANMLTIPSIITDNITVGNIMLNTSISNTEINTSVIKCKYGEVDILFGENSKSIVNKGYVDTQISTAIAAIPTITITGSRNITVSSENKIELNGNIAGLYSIGTSVLNASSQVKIGDTTNGMTTITNDVITTRSLSADVMTVSNIATTFTHVTNKRYVDDAIYDAIELSKPIAGPNIEIRGNQISLVKTVVLENQTLFDGSTTLRLSGNGIEFTSGDNVVNINKTGSDFKLHPTITRDEHVDVLNMNQLITKANLYESMGRFNMYQSRLLNVNEVMGAIWGIKFELVGTTYTTTYVLLQVWDGATHSLFQPNADSVRRVISRGCFIRISPLTESGLVELNLHLVINNQSITGTLPTQYTFYRTGLIFKESVGFYNVWSNVGDSYSTNYDETEELQTNMDSNYPYIETLQFISTSNSQPQHVAKVGNALIFINSSVAKTDTSTGEYRINGNDICRLK